MWTLTAHDDGSGPAIYAGGAFYEAGGIDTNLIARWNGASWSTLGSGLAGASPFYEDCFALTVWDPGAGPILVAGGQFTTAGGNPALNVASWDGAGWQPLGSGLTGAASDARVHALASWDDGTGSALYAAGEFTLAGVTPVSRVAKWDGASWTALGTGLDKEALALTVHTDAGGRALYVGGTFQQAGGLPAAHVARWDGTTWSALGSGLDGDVNALVSHARALYAGGTFTEAGGSPALGIARWDGDGWSPLGAGLDGPVHALVSYDDGSGGGPALYAGGVFANAGGTPAKNIARWDGTSWTALPGLDGQVKALAELPDGQGWPELFAGGLFGIPVGGPPSWNIASLSNPCACQAVTYCTAGTTASGCTALISASGAASATAGGGFQLSVAGAEGSKSGLFFFSTNGAQAHPWGNGTSFLCVVPPFVRTGVLPGSGTSGACDGAFQLDFNAWMMAHPTKAPTAGETAFVQCWFRDPLNTSNQTSSLSNALRASVCP